MYALPNVPTARHNGITFYQIRGASMSFVSPCGHVYSLISNRLFSAKPNNIGYIKVSIPYDDQPDRKLCSMQRLVAECFIPNPENKPDVNHRDGNKANNHVSNLEWVTKSENTRHAYATGLMKAKKGEDHHRYGKSFSAETKAKMSAQKQGEKHPKFTGWYITPEGRFASANAGAVPNNTSAKQVHRWCKGGKMIAQGWDFEPINPPQALALAA